MPAPAQVGVRVVRVRRKQAELSKNARLRKRLQKLRESSRKLLGIHKVAPEPTFDDKLDALFARYDTDHNNLIDADADLRWGWHGGSCVWVDCCAGAASAGLRRWGSSNDTPFAAWAGNELTLRARGQR